MTGGVFITLEGIEGAGKTSAVGYVLDWLRVRGRESLATREPGSTAIGEKIRTLLLARNTGPMLPMTELLLMFAARAQHLDEVIRPALRRGACVVCDRFTDATYAYQGGGRGLADAAIAGLERLVHADLQPQLTLLLDAEPRVGLRRARGRGDADRFESEQVAFFERVRAAYLSRAARYPQRFVVIDANQDIGAVHARIGEVLEQRLP